MKHEEETSGPTPADIEGIRRRDAVRLETGGMAVAFNALLPLDHEARRRAIRWLTDALDNIEVPF